ncbi:MAG TPA: hypothetical protein VIK32_05485 [Candidatus Limnocylindrales bacterium]
MDTGLYIFVAIAAALLIGAWVYAIALSKGTSDEVGWFRLLARLVVFALALANLALHSPVLWWIASAVVILWVVYEFVRWRRRAPQRKLERDLRLQRRTEVSEILDQYQRTHPAAESADGSPGNPPADTP